jgi:AraC family ethanolamine operon transcriptional activator
VKVQHRLITSVDELVDPVASARMQPMVLRAGAIRAEWCRADLDGVIIEVRNYSFPVATRGETRPDRVSVLTPLARATGHLNGAALTPGLLYTAGPQTEVEGATGGACSVGVVSVPTGDLDRLAVGLGVDLDVPDAHRFRVVAAAEPSRWQACFGSVMRAAEHGRDCSPSPCGARASVLELVARTFDRARQTTVPPRHANSLRIANACADRARANRYHDVTLATLCQASGVSERHVRQAFYDCYGMSPTAYLRVAALHSVRRGLVAGPPRRDAVSRAASEYGFWHLGRFAAQYRALFGESPNQTVGRRPLLRASS